MDLSFIQEQLDTFATFAGAIGDFLQKPVEFFNGLVDWLNGDEPNPLGKLDNDDEVINTNSSKDWDTTIGVLSSDSADSGEDAGSSLSSSDKDAE